MKTLLRRFPFTLTMLVLLGLTAILTNTQVATISTEWLNRLGFAPVDLLALDLGRLFTSALVTSGGRVFWEALGMVAFAVGLSRMADRFPPRCADLLGRTPVHVGARVAVHCVAVALGRDDVWLTGSAFAGCRPICRLFRRVGSGQRTLETPLEPDQRRIDIYRIAVGFVTRQRE